MDDSEVTSLTPLFAVNYRGVQLFAAPYARRAPIDGDVELAPAAAGNAEVREWTGQDRANDVSLGLNSLPLRM
jgi:hypothetical protein